jgi:glycosyltransferase involved in cell wall biosynthesis
MAIKIFLHIPDDKACTVYRATLPMLHLYNDLSLHGIHITGDVKTLPCEKFDIFVFNRLIRPNFYQEVIAPWLEQGKKFAWQADDDLWQITEWNPVHTLLNEHDLLATELYISKCEYAWVSTEPLAKVINAPEKTKVLPNLVDVNHYDAKIEHSTTGPLKIVWCGSSSHDKDFEAVIKPIIKILEKHKQDIAVIFWGYLPTELANFERQPGFPHADLVPKYENLYCGEWFSHREYFYKLRHLKPDIAIMPLDDCVFNHSKSNLKYLEMSMAGAACIATDLPPYDCITNKENGLLVKPGDEQGWFDALDELIQNREYRLKLNDNARDLIHQKYTWQSPARQLWLQAYLDLVSRHQ